MEECRRGFIVHAYADMRRSRLCILGCLDDGKSFAAIETQWRPSLLIYENEKERCRKSLSSIKFEIRASETESFEGIEKLLELKFNNYRDRTAASKIIGENGIRSPDCFQKIPEAYLVNRGIRGPAEIKGESRQGRLVDLVFIDPEITALRDFSPLLFPLKICSVDIETDVKTGVILAIGFSVSAWNSTAEKSGLVRILTPVSIRDNPPVPDTDDIFFHHDEESMLRAFLDDMEKAGADILTGWNFLDFDFPRLAERCQNFNILFLLGRSTEEAKFFAGASSVSAAALVPGRQVIDALRIVRSGPKKFSGYTLETVANAVLGEGKAVSSTGKDKIDELEKLYNNDPVSFGKYCKRDAELVPEILEKTGLMRLTIERASLTGVSLDKAWTSVVTFEKIYGLELVLKKTAPPPDTKDRKVSGAAGGTVLDPVSGIFPNVGVFDFRSLYPTIMRTFNIDPLAHERAGKETGEEQAASSDINNSLIRAPNGAAFSRERGILPEIIASYFEERKKALASGDEEASHVYKILMNCFYGVLGTSSCRYGKTELAGAITSFARKWLLFSRDWFNNKGFRVLYGDTDSLFVESGLDDNAPYAAFLEWGNRQAAELNRSLGEAVRAEYDLQSCMELRFEKPYRRFLIPPLRNSKGENRGRAKGYGGWRMDPAGNFSIEIRGMEAVRSDWTPLARRIQVELLEMIFNGCGNNEIKSYIQEIAKKMRRGNLDKELIYRKRLARSPEEYTSSTPPQVKAARALGWKKRRGTVEYIMTVSGPEPVELPHGQPDYDHYMDSQVLPVAQSIAAAAGWETGLLSRNKNDHLGDGQIDLDF